MTKLSGTRAMTTGVTIGGDDVRLNYSLCANPSVETKTQRKSRNGKNTSNGMKWMRDIDKHNRTTVRRRGKNRQTILVIESLIFAKLIFHLMIAKLSSFRCIPIIAFLADCCGISNAINGSSFSSIVIRCRRFFDFFFFFFFIVIVAIVAEKVQ